MHPMSLYHDTSHVTVSSSTPYHCIIMHPIHQTPYISARAKLFEKQNFIAFHIRQFLSHAYMQFPNFLSTIVCFLVTSYHFGSHVHQGGFCGRGQFVLVSRRNVVKRVKWGSTGVIYPH
eukprot:GHVO01038764.1.p1 GENE.GHVO01038764.1~~GHVO01038764.1.p1  ORF type:complete len:119 (-),score=1.12 GHVO01038764.1:610-966(-)